jgi:hypothetical protein
MNPLAFANALGARIHGKYFQYSCIEIAVAGGIQANISEITYSHKLDPGTFRGTSPKVRGRTLGTYDAEGSFTIYKEDYEMVKAALASRPPFQGYMAAEFDITVSYRDAGAHVPVTDQLIGCRITSEENNHQSGNDALLVRVQLNIMEIIANDQRAIIEGAAIPGIPSL